MKTIEGDAKAYKDGQYVLKIRAEIQDAVTFTRLRILLRSGLHINLKSECYMLKCIIGKTESANLQQRRDKIRG